MLQLKKRVIISLLLSIISLLVFNMFIKIVDWELFVIISVISYLFFYKITNFIATFKTEQYKSKIDIIFLTVFFIFLFIPMSHIDKSAISQKENRTLAKFPSIKADGNLNYKFGIEYNNWFNDRFFMRNTFISIYEKKYLFAKEFETKNLIKGKDGWLFLGTKEAKESYINKELFSETDLNKISKYLKDIDEYCKANNKKFYFIIPPDKPKIYGEFYTDLIRPVRDSGKAEQLIKYMNDNSKVKVLYLKDVLLLNKDNDLIYYKNDTHWNGLGAYYAYKRIIKMINSDYKNIAVYKIKKFKQIEHSGDLSKMTGLPEKEFNYKYNVPDMFDKKSVCNNATKKECNNLSEKLNMVMFGDSFSEELDNYLAESFSKLRIIRSHSITKKDIEKYDIVILEVIERDLPKIVKEEFGR